MKHRRDFLHLQGSVEQKMFGFCHFEAVDIFMQGVTAASANRTAECGHGDVQTCSDSKQIRLLIDACIQRFADMRHRFCLLEPVIALDTQ